MRRCLVESVFMCQFCSTRSQGKAPTMNTITLPPDSTSHRSHCCLQGLERTSKACDFAFLSRALQPLELPPLTKSPASLVPTAILNVSSKHTGFSSTAYHSGRVEWDTWSFLCGFWYEQSHFLCVYIAPSSWCTCTTHGQGEAGVNQEALSQSLR